MPSYEMALIVRAMDKTGLSAKLKQVGGKILQSGGVIRKVENLGTRPLPFITKAPRQTVGSYFLIYYHATPQAVQNCTREIKLDSAVLRVNSFREMPSAVRQCQTGPCYWGEATEEVWHAVEGPNLRLYDAKSDAKKKR